MTAADPRSVRGTIRSLAKSQATLEEAFRTQIDDKTLEIVEVPDVLAPGALDEPVRGVVGVAHIASPGMNPEDLRDPAAVIDRCREGTLNVCRSIEQNAGPQLRGVVLISSLAASMGLSDPPGYRYTGHEFNEAYVDMTLGLGSKAPGPLTYCAVKVAIEKVYRDYFLGRPLPFAAVTVSPSFTIGPVVVRPKELKSLPAGVRTVWHVLAGGAWADDFTTPAFVDVRDIGRACVLGVEGGDKVHGRRLFLSAYRGTSQAVADILREELPEYRDRIRPGNPTGKSPDDVSWGPEEVGVDGSLYEELSGKKYRTYRESVVASARSFEPYLAAGEDKNVSDEVPVLFDL